MLLSGACPFTRCLAHGTLPPCSRAWRRAGSGLLSDERRGVASAAHIAADLAALNAPPALLAAAARVIADEIHHLDVCACRPRRARPGKARPHTSERLDPAPRPGPPRAGGRGRAGPHAGRRLRAGQAGVRGRVRCRPRPEPRAAVRLGLHRAAARRGPPRDLRRQDGGLGDPPLDAPASAAPSGARPSPPRPKRPDSRAVAPGSGGRVARPSSRYLRLHPAALDPAAPRAAGDARSAGERAHALALASWRPRCPSSPSRPIRIPVSCGSHATARTTETAARSFLRRVGCHFNRERSPRAAKSPRAAVSAESGGRGRPARNRDQGRTARPARKGIRTAAKEIRVDAKASPRGRARRRRRGPRGEAGLSRSTRRRGG